MHLRLLLASLVLLASTLLASDNPAYQQSLDAGKALLERNDPAAALAQLQQAVAAEPSRHEPYFYLAIASYRADNLSAAEDYAKLALERAPDAEKPRVDEMLKVIAEKRDFARLEHEGDEALAKGLRNKAAESYRKAFLLFPTQGRLGLKAAAIFADNLRRPLDAATLWQKIAATSDTASADAARQELNQRSTALQALFNEQLVRAAEHIRDGDVAALARFAEAFPDRAEPQVELAAFYASKSDFEKLVEHLGRASAIGVDVKTIQYRRELLYAIHDEKRRAPLVAFIEDAFGPDIVEFMQKMPTAEYEVREKPEHISLLRNASEAGFGWADNALGRCYATGTGVPKDEAAAVKFYRQGVDRNSLDATYWLADSYRWGTGVSQDLATAVTYYKQGIARGDASCMWALGNLYLEGKAVPADEPEGIRLLTAAADGKFHGAMTDLANHYLARRNFEKALEWATRAAESDSYNKSTGLYLVGLCRRDGPPGIQNRTLARESFAKAAELNHSEAKAALATVQ